MQDTQLPTLPHPATLTASDASTYLLIAETKRNYDRLQQIKDEIASGSIGISFSHSFWARLKKVDYSLSPSPASALPPLPPVPIPPRHQSIRRASTSTAAKTIKPINRPPIPPDSFLVRKQNLAQLVEALNDQNGSSRSGTGLICHATLRYSDTAIYLEFGDGGSDGSAWILQKRLRRDGKPEDGQDARMIEVESVKVFPPSEVVGVAPITVKC